MNQKSQRDLTRQLAQTITDIDRKMVAKHNEIKEQINGISFSSLSNSSVIDALEQWKKSLHLLLDQADDDEEKLEVVKGYIKETQQVITTLNKAVSFGNQETNEEKNARDALILALQSFENKVLKLSFQEEMLASASMFLGAAIGLAIGIGIAIALSAPLLVLLIGGSLGLMGIAIANYVSNDRNGLNAVAPEKKDCITDKLTAFGIFGNTPKHKARNLLDAICTENNLELAESSILSEVTP